jgi:hypothetical protein
VTIGARKIASRAFGSRDFAVPGSDGALVLGALQPIELGGSPYQPTRRRNRGMPPSIHPYAQAQAMMVLRWCRPEG